MITVNQAIEFLKTYNGESELRWVDGSQIRHINAIDGLVVLSDTKYIGYCGKCDGEVYTEKENRNGYDGYCITCDENLYGHEIINRVDI